MLQGCSAYRADGHWHYVTYGLSNVFDEDEGDNHGFSGNGCELTWRIRDEGGAADAPGWPFTVLQRIAKWAIDERFVLMEGRQIALSRPVTGYPDTGGPDTPQTSLLLVTDPELGEIDTVNGRVEFVQLVAVDNQTLADVSELGIDAMVDRLHSGTGSWRASSGADFRMLSRTNTVRCFPPRTGSAGELCSSAGGGRVPGVLRWGTPGRCLSSPRARRRPSGRRRWPDPPRCWFRPPTRKP